MPKNLKFLAIPFYELYENAQAYGPQLAALPHYLARYRFEYMDDNGNTIAEMPGGPQYPGARTTRDDPRYRGNDVKPEPHVKTEEVKTEVNGNGDGSNGDDDMVS